eukprot:scaffold22058_cov124-Isochrysis_galbana.AAC.5
MKAGGMAAWTGKQREGGSTRPFPACPSAQLGASEWASNPKSVGNREQRRPNVCPRPCDAGMAGAGWLQCPVP